MSDWFCTHGHYVKLALNLNGMTKIDKYDVIEQKNNIKLRFRSTDADIYEKPIFEAQYSAKF